MSESKIMIVPGLPDGATGLVVLWRLSGEVDLEKLAAAWLAAGLDEKLLPKPASPVVALHRAVVELQTRHQLVRKIEGERAGWAVVEERQDGNGMEAQLNYNVTTRVRLVGDEDAEQLEFLPPDGPLVGEVRTEYERARRQLSQQDVSVWLVRRVEELRAVALRDTGGIYFVPRDAVDRWRAMCGALARASQNRVLDLPALRDDEAVAFVLDALARESERAATEMEKELETGDLGERALRTRTARCGQMEQKLRQYEDLLGVQLDGMRSRIEQLQARMTAAMAIEMVRAA